LDLGRTRIFNFVIIATARFAVVAVGAHHADSAVPEDAGGGSNAGVPEIEDKRALAVLATCCDTFRTSTTLRKDFSGRCYDAHVSRCRFVPSVRVLTEFLALFLLLLVSTRAAKAGDASAPSCVRDIGDSSAKDCLCRLVHRKRHHFRHWVWSGIFPGEGGFIADPHYLCSRDGIFPEPVNEAISDKESRYAIVDVNPFFNDRSSEVLLFVKRRDEVYEYSLSFPKHKGVRAILSQSTAPPALVFPYKTGLAVLVDFTGPAKGAYTLPLPLRKKRALELVRTGTSEFAEIADAFRFVAQDRTTKDQFCSATNDFIAFYEKFSGPCDGHIIGTTEVERNFARFWPSN
jgi:hypothetical protein